MNKELEQKVIDFMFKNDYINEKEHEHWFENDIVEIDEKVFKLYLALEEIRKLHLAVDEETKISNYITKVLVKYENM